MDNTLITFICNILIAFNIVYSQAAAYKESISDYTKSKTINGYLLAVFTVFAKVGNFVYRLTRRVTNLNGDSKSKTTINYFVTGTMDTLMVFIISLFMYKMFGTYNSSVNVEDFTFMEKILHFRIYFVHFLVTLAYYGFLYGLFGGDNCRIQESILSKPFNALQKVGQAMTTKETGLSVDSIKEAISDERDATVNNSIAASIINYGKSSIGRILSTIGENVSSLVSVYVGAKNILSFIMFLVVGYAVGYAGNFLLWFNTGRQIAVEGAEDIVADALGNPVEIITDNIKDFLIIMLIVCIVKIVARLVISILPRPLQTKIYDGSYKLNVKSQQSLKKMSDDNFNSDSYAQKYSNELIRAARRGDPRWYDK